MLSRMCSFFPRRVVVVLEAAVARAAAVAFVVDAGVA
jgi:hypothetical protein